MTATDYRGHQIAYSDIRFEGSPRTVFWTRYTGPFLEDIAFRAVDYAQQLTTEEIRVGRRPKCKGCWLATLGKCMAVWA
jgi:hypothetical protein